MGVLAAVALSSVAGCDTFFVAQGRVTRCADAVAIAGARVRLQLVSGGYSEREERETVTAADGRFNLTLNEPASVQARVLVSAAGYRDLQRDYGSSPGVELALCLEPQ